MGGEDSHADVTLVGRTVGHYRVLEELGHGGMGTVYLAEDAQLGRSVALKVLADRIAGDERALREFESEARLLAALNHPNIATIHSLEEDGGLRFLTMELVPGHTLGERLAEGAMDVDLALAFARQIARALEAAHAKGVVHRDLKPSNVRISPEGRVKVLDFGLARQIEPASSGGETTRKDTTQREGLAGTPGYMSPEQLREMPADPRADVWAFGCVLYECLTGRPAFPGRTIADRIAATLEREPDWSCLPEGVGERVRGLLRRCLAKEAENRPPDLGHVRWELEEEIACRRLQHVPALASPPAGPASPGNLPRRLDSFIGRERELEEIAAAMSRAPLVTLTGPGGSGKTRLALEAAVRAAPGYRDGIWLVELGPLSDPERVSRAVARALAVGEEPHRSPRETLLDALRERRLLILLDNCEHLLRASAELAEDLLRACPGLAVLATSREALHVAGETVYHVPPLAVPDPSRPRSAVRDVEDVDSVRLFVERARAARPSFQLDEGNVASVAQICGRLDGIPLALELAAARVGALPVAEIAQRLDDRFSLLTEGRQTSLPQHKTLRALVDWSHDLLDPRERALLRRLSVFAGGWTLDAAERVCSGGEITVWEVLDLHSHLVEKSLVEMVAEGATETGRTRFRMLETVRQYARERLHEHREEADAVRRHRDFFLELAEAAEPHLRDADQTRWLFRLGLEHENLRAAFEACAVPGVAPELGLRLAGALGRYWMVRGHWSEGRGLCGQVLERAADAGPSDPRARTLNAAGNLAFHQGNYEEAHFFHEQALGIRCHLGDRRGQAASLNNLGEVARLRGHYDAACEFYEQAADIQREIDDTWGLAVSLNNLGETAQNRGDYERARAYHEGALKLWPSVGDRWGVAWSCSNLGFVAAKQGRLVDARSCYERSLSLGRELGDRFGIALSLHALGDVAVRQDDAAAARAFHAESLEIRQDLGNREGIAESLESFASLAAKEDAAQAVRLLAAAAATRRRIDAPPPDSRREELDGIAARARDALGESAYAREWERGGSLSLEEAAAEALAQRGAA